MTDQNGILDRAGGVADPLGTQRPDRAPDARRPGRLAGVDGGTQAQAPGSLVDGSERLGRERLLRATQADADHAELANLGHRLQGGGRRLQGGVADQVGDQDDFDVGDPVQPGPDGRGQGLYGQAWRAKSPGEKNTSV